VIAGAAEVDLLRQSRWRRPAAGSEVPCCAVSGHRSLNAVPTSSGNDQGGLSTVGEAEVGPRGDFLIRETMHRRSRSKSTGTNRSTGPSAAACPIGGRERRERRISSVIRDWPNPSGHLVVTVRCRRAVNDGGARIVRCCRRRPVRRLPQCWRQVVEQGRALLRPAARARSSPGEDRSSRATSRCAGTS